MIDHPQWLSLILKFGTYKVSHLGNSFWYL